MQTFIGTQIRLLFRMSFYYYLEGFHLCFPHHTLVPRSRRITRVQTKWYKVLTSHLLREVPALEDVSIVIVHVAVDVLFVVAGRLPVGAGRGGGRLGTATARLVYEHVQPLSLGHRIRHLHNKSPCSSVLATSKVISG